ncbi:rhodanese-like domain-containing protein, partial [Duncaniella muris]|uniref:rhodanese-like domain-containing protein n=1 Tax=Duncaniella muris TaxID=2094150 RepID=UPI00351C913C
MNTKLISLIIIVMCAIQSCGCSHTDNIVSVSASEFEKEIKTDSVTLLDVRTPQEYAEGQDRK